MIFRRLWKIFLHCEKILFPPKQLLAGTCRSSKVIFLFTKTFIRQKPPFLTIIFLKRWTNIKKSEKQAFPRISLRCICFKDEVWSRVFHRQSAKMNTQTQYGRD